MARPRDHWKNNLDEALAILEKLDYLTEDEYGELKGILPEGHPNYQILKEAMDMARKVKGPKKLVRRRKVEIKD